MMQKVLDINLKVHGPNHLEVAQTKVNIANVLQQQGQLQPALEKYNEALPVLEATLGREHLDVAKTYNKYDLFFDSFFFMISTDLLMLCAALAMSWMTWARRKRRSRT